MNPSSRSHSFGAWPRLFELLLSGLLLIGVITAVIVFTATIYLAFAEKVPEILARDIKVEVDSQTYKLTTAGESILPFDIDYVGVLLPIPVDQPRLLMTYNGTALIGILLGLASMFQLRKFVQSLRRDHPFLPENAHRLRCVAWLMLFGGIWQVLARFITTFTMSGGFPDLDLNVSVQGGGIPLLTVLTFFIIAEVFALGVKMKEEAELTV